MRWGRAARSQAGASSRDFFFGGCGQLFPGRSLSAQRARRGWGAHVQELARPGHAPRRPGAHAHQAASILPSGLAGVPAASLLTQPPSHVHNPRPVTTHVLLPSCCPQRTQMLVPAR